MVATTTAENVSSETGELKLVRRFCTSVDTELEAVFRDITPVDFQNLIKFFRSNPDYDVKPNPDRLDVILHDKTRVTITDQESIRTFVTRNQARYASVMRKTPVANVDFPDAGFRLNLKREKVYGAHEKCPADLLKPSSRVPPVDRVYRLIKRFSCVALDGLCRFDISAVKYASSSLPSFRDVPDRAFRESFEVEVECIERREAPEVILDALLHNIAIINAIVAPIVDRRVVEEMERLSGVRGFLGPNLVTLDKVNLLPPDVDIISVRNGDYVVTEKADGDRTLLFVDARGIVYAIDNRLRFATVGKAASIRSSILDCERVLGKKFLVFDIYFFESRSVADLPLIRNPDVASADDRLTYVARAVHDIGMLDGFEIAQKKYYDENDACTVLSDFRLGRLGDYEIDGLVYMPRSMPVGAMFVGDKARLAATRWDYAFKWKPPTQNTVDFQVVFALSPEPTTSTTADNVEKVVRARARAPKAAAGGNGNNGTVYLYVGHKPWSEAIRPLDFLMGRPRPVNEYGRKLFEPAPTALLSYDSLKKEFVCADGSPIQDGCVVEFSFDKGAAGGGQWRAERLRPDKNGKGGNDYETAIRVWGTINDPLLEEHVCGKVPVAETKESLLEDRYSLRSLDRNQLGSRNMARFHGWLKDRLIAMAFEVAGRSAVAPERRKVKVLDLACGKGGDMDKMRRHGVGAVVGIDSAKDSIVNGNDGTYARMYKDPREYKSFVFGYYDLSKPLTVEGFNAHFARDGSESDKEMHQILLSIWGAPSSVDLGASRNGLATEKFDVVTCMFALHYFFKNEGSLDTFLDNVSNNLREGGVFAGCCFDGASVEAALAEEARGLDDELLLVQPRLLGRLDNGRLVWLVEATPTTFSPLSEKVRSRKSSGAIGKEKRGTGREIRVYIDSINHKISEYLVDFDFLQERALAKGLTMLMLDCPASDQKTLPATSGLFPQALRLYDAASGLSDAEKRYSSFNRWFMFQKSTN